MTTNSHVPLVGDVQALIEHIKKNGKKAQRFSIR